MGRLQSTSRTRMTYEAPIGITMSSLIDVFVPDRAGPRKNVV